MDTKKNAKEAKAKSEKLEEVVAETIPEADVAKETETVVAEAQADDKLSEELKAVKEALEKKDAELVELKDRMIRLQADTDNYRKRLVRDKEDAVKFANTALIKDILGPMDDFKRAIEASEKTKDYDAMHDGIVMIDDRLYSLLKNNWGLEEIGVEGEDFDANQHEACMVGEDEKVDHEVVSTVFQKGYKLHGRVLRAAKVKVAKPCN
jgi:Molecular chaperone GrpE (heat shock protein)